MNQFAQKIYSHILQEISIHNLLPGNRVPTEMSLAEKFSTTRMNAHAALAHLKNEGIIVREKRRGSFISEDVSEESIKLLQNEVSKTVSILFSELVEHEYFHWNNSTLNELEKSFNLCDYNVVYSEMPDKRDHLATMLNQFNLQGINSVIIIVNYESLMFLMKNIDIVRNSSAEVFLLLRGNVPVEHFFCNVISLDPFGEGYQIGEFLLKAQIRRIAFLGFKSHVKESKHMLSYWAMERFKGVECALTLADDNKLEFYTEEDWDLLGRDGVDFIKSGGDVIVAQNDYTAAFFIDYADKAELKVGIDYKIIGFDDDPKCRKYNLTTVAPPVDGIARFLSNLIVDHKWKKIEDTGRIVFKVKSRVIVRNSCRFIDA